MWTAYMCHESARVAAGVTVVTDEEEAAVLKTRFMHVMHSGIYLLYLRYLLPYLFVRYWYLIKIWP